MTRYSIFSLARNALLGHHEDWPQAWRSPEPKSEYDAVIVGGGGHGLATAYYLAKDHGITNVAVLEKGYLAGGNTARNTTIVRSNYLTPEGVRFYDESVRLFRALSNEFDFNILYSERGHLTLAHTDAAVRTMRWRAEVNKHLGVRSELIFPDEIRKLVPCLNLSEDVRYPILARSITSRGRSPVTMLSPGVTPGAPPVAASRSIS